MSILFDMLLDLICKYIKIVTPRNIPKSFSTCLGYFVGII